MMVSAATDYCADARGVMTASRDQDDISTSCRQAGALWQMGVGL